MATTPSPIRMQTRAVVRSLLAQTAMQLFAEKGFAETTVEEVAAAAGVSRRTLFNYFRTKEDLALSGLSEQGDVIAARLGARPADEDVWVSLRHSFVVLDEIEADPQNRLEIVSMLFDNDSLRAGHAEKQARWTDLLAPLIEPKLAASQARSFSARAIVATAITCLQAATEEWLRLRGSTPLFDLYDTAIEAIRNSN
ncbi:helix-turn-helix domain containing protein [Streptomyces sp. ME02-8801-2C]|uniref:TetR/AcrR family transcriptional regulator n=1 Tax=Streptomyces sp. ME02-8801-2C TaxID=3028680 RepID=UPI0029A5B55A|nr:helix-turn-helix domain-containing protein [Streptomyces sp. ME02-8801-2C]MDX3452090.1 helix-turn-helix domain containing protein [Streptomyces sp. ME02-8801-2C]